MGMETVYTACFWPGHFVTMSLSEGRTWEQLQVSLEGADSGTACHWVTIHRGATWEQIQATVSLIVTR